MSTAPVPNGELNYVDEGAGVPLVLLHGGALDLRMWDAQAAALRDDHRVIRLDARGHGRSSTPKHPFRQCDDVVALLDHLDVGRAVLVGLSMGAGAATDTTLEYPQRVAALAVSGAGTNEPTFTDPWILDRFRELTEAQERLDAPGWVAAFVEMGVVGPHRTRADVAPEVLAACTEMATDTVTTHAVPDAVAPEHVAGSWARLPEIDVPAMTIAGGLDADDHLAMMRRFADGVAGCRSVTIDGAAHTPNMERPGEFTAAVRELVSQV